MPPPKIFQAFKRSTSRGGSAAPTHGMEPRPYEYGSVGRNSHYRPDTMYTDATGHSAYSGRTAIDDDEDYEDLGEYSNARHHAIPVELSDTSESRIPRVQRMDDPRSTMYDTIPEEDEETARTVSDDYVDIGHHPHGDYYHRSRSSHYTDDTMMQDYGPLSLSSTSRDAYALETWADYRDYGAASSSHRQAKYQETTAKVNFAPQERHRDRYDRRDNREQTLPRREYTQPAVHTISHSGSRRRGETYYIIPGNKPVIFKDQRGNEIARVGDFSGKTRSRRRHPIIVQDEYGHELYRSGDVDDPYGRSRDHGNHRYASLFRHGVLRVVIVPP
ncbi:hypothetical protein GLOTRDRAFT_125606 [Gloeophyllum trabeum ATCC 11539]|uniref:Uncharacterized protein n=1 Tax=Gloeophyllum trabeum (strain ATCC 11539 / FP-39264 / Madison 617) TaxID=670483 RepID=S7RWM1_GLOTA|nr:uncharacterized protein GLOTRDRAFT_125606 [Gloeophyllum trabeum ATCC 11539]EPQ59300.1 hypothetical protein GLOTRDRAFT_125606 [Gloeophyllum trabeum ATCC 11539]